jgi:diacylglycerol kinase (ATP)
MKRIKRHGVGITRLLQASLCSWKGFVFIWNNEEAFRQEFLLSLVLIPLGFFLGDNGMEQSLLIGTVLFVMVVEILNTAIECAIDRISTGRNELSGHAKDLGSLAVLTSLLILVAVWSLILAF